MGKGDRVTVIVAAVDSSLLIELSSAEHVWALRTVETEEVARQVWAATAAPDDLTRSLTLFNSAGAPEASLLDILGTVEEHHGAYSYLPSATVMTVIGVEATAAIREELRGLGFADLTETPEGFTARRAE